MSLPWKSRHIKPKVRGLRSRNSFLLLIFLPILHSCYVTKLAFQHNNQFNSRRLVSSILSDPNTDIKVRKKLLLFQEVMAYAAGRGLNTRRAYRYYIETGEDAVSYLVQAAYADRLESYTWWYPIVGTVPYKGFFDKAERDGLGEELKADGYDVYLSRAGAYSSLGWFEDPIYSVMLRRSTSGLAALIFHELTHRTLWIPGHVKFNENLASFMEDRLTVQYLEEKGKERSLDSYAIKKADKKLYREWLKRLRDALKQFYKNTDFSLDKKQATLGKAKLFERYTKELRPKFQRYDYVGNEPWNNARVLGTSLYSPDLDRFSRAYSCHKHLNAGAFLKVLGDTIKGYDDPFIALDSLCK
ncbi:MAG: aminopeptidase [Oligoflexales bacterium]|nr:aminopeptidase [Oligoflexales bacterium]